LDIVIDVGVDDLLVRDVLLGNENDRRVELVGANRCC
jgi:hypothetical protein